MTMATTYFDVLVDDVLRGPLAERLVSTDDLVQDLPHLQFAPALEAAREGLFDLLALRSTDKKRYSVFKDAPRPTRVDWMCRLLRRGDQAAFLAMHFSPQMLARLLPHDPPRFSALSPSTRTHIVENPAAYVAPTALETMANVYTGHYTSLLLAAGRHGASDVFDMLDFCNAVASVAYARKSEEHYYHFFTGMYRQWYPQRPPHRAMWIGLLTAPNDIMSLANAARQHGDFDIIGDVACAHGQEVLHTATRMRPLVPFTSEECRLLREPDSADALLALFLQKQDIGVLFSLAAAPLSDVVVTHIVTGIGLLSAPTNRAMVFLWDIWAATWILASGRPRYLELFAAVFATSPGGLPGILARVRTLRNSNMQALFAPTRRAAPTAYPVRAPLAATDVRDLIAFEREHPGVIANVHANPIVHGYTLSIEGASVAEWNREVGDGLGVLPLTLVAPIVISLLDTEAFQPELPRILRPVVARLARVQKDVRAPSTVVGELAYRIAAWNPAFFWEEATAVLSTEAVVMAGFYAQDCPVYCALPPVRSALTPVDFTIACLRYYYRHCPRREMRDFRETKADEGFAYNMMFRGQARIFAVIEQLAARVFDSKENVQ